MRRFVFRLRHDQYIRLRVQAAGRRMTMARFMRQILDLGLSLSEASGQVTLSPQELATVLRALEGQGGTATATVPVPTPPLRG